jgi:hypothetical protein
MNGDKETFSKNLDSMDLIFDPAGKLLTVHLILLTNGEKDTHYWYQVQNLASFSYRFLNLAGKGKVRVKMLKAFDPADSALQPPPPVQLKDYH